MGHGGESKDRVKGEIEAGAPRELEQPKPIIDEIFHAGDAKEKPTKDNKMKTADPTPRS